MKKKLSELKYIEKIFSGQMEVKIMNIDKIYEIICKLPLEDKITIYNRLQANIEDEELLKEAEYRIINAKDDDFVSEDEVLKALGITKGQLNHIKVELE